MEQPEGGDKNTYGRGKVTASRCPAPRDSPALVRQEGDDWPHALFIFKDEVSPQGGGAACSGGEGRRHSLILGGHVASRWAQMANQGVTIHNTQ